MNQSEFLSALAESLRGLPESEVQDILAEYEAHFRDGLSEGRPETELAAALGDPATIGRLYQADRAVQQAEHAGSVMASLRAVFAIISLGLLNILLVIGPLAVAVLSACAAWLTALVLAAGGTFLIVGALLVVLAPGWFALGGISPWALATTGVCFGVAALSFSGLIGLAAWRFSGWLAGAILQYLKTHLSSIQEGGKHEHP